MIALESVAPVRPGCRLTVAIPAHNEAANIGAAIASLAAQSDLARLDALIFVNNSTDRSAAEARDAARSHPALAVHVIEAELPPAAANAGAARRAVMDLAVQRLLAADVADGIVATTDADTVLDPAWSTHVFTQIQEVDALAGLVDLWPLDLAAMPASVRLRYQRELELRRVWTAFESLVDPRPEDPEPRHGAFVTANLAVTIRAYRAAGGMPPLATLEDRQFLAALRRIDARVRHSLQVRSWTSARRTARVNGGFGSFIDSLYTSAATQSPQLVADPQPVIAAIVGRAMLRRLWRGETTAAAFAAASSLFTLSARVLRAQLEQCEPFGTVHERIVALAATNAPAARSVPIEAAIEAFSRASVEYRRLT